MNSGILTIILLPKKFINDSTIKMKMKTFNFYIKSNVDDMNYGKFVFEHEIWFLYSILLARETFYGASIQIILIHQRFQKG